jgi:transposase InsO family protein
VLDAWSRRIVGWAFSADLKTRVVPDALDMALAARKPENVIHHSDQGSQGGFNRSSQHRHHTVERGTDRALRSVFSIRVFFGAGCS